MGRIANAAEVIEYIQTNPGITGSELARRFELAERTARRYVQNFKVEEAVPAVNMGQVVFDIETTNFDTAGQMSKLLCASFYDMQTHEVDTLSLEFEDRDDQRLLREVAKKLAQYLFQVGHNIAAFDYGWLNSRLMFYGYTPLDISVYFDTFQNSKSLAIKTKKSLGNLCDYFGIKRGEKTSIYKTSWSKVFSKDPGEFSETMEDIVYHCENDVVLNYQLFGKLHEYALQNSGRANPWKVSKFKGVYWRAQ